MFGRKARVIRLITAVCLSAGFQILFRFATQAFLQIAFLFIAVLLSAGLYFFNVLSIRHYQVGSVRLIIRDDAVFFVLPSVLISVFTELICSLSLTAKETAGMGTILYGSAMILVAAVFWLVYYLTNKFYQ